MHTTIFIEQIEANKKKSENLPNADFFIVSILKLLHLLRNYPVLVSSSNVWNILPANTKSFANIFIIIYGVVKDISAKAK